MSFDTKPYTPESNIRVVTATSLFDGHDASINIVRRLLQSTGVEVIHLGHNRSVHEIVDAAVDEDAQGIAVSSYQGGHIEFFKYMVDLLKERGASHIKVFGGGGGVIIPEEIKELEEYGVAKIYSPEDGARRGLQGIINHMVESLDFPTVDTGSLDLKELSSDNKLSIARLITAVELTKARDEKRTASIRNKLSKKVGEKKIPVVGITGTGGAGKSSLTDEIVLRLLRDLKDIRVAIVSCDPSRRKSGGALLGDRIRMNAIGSPRVYMRSLATRKSQMEVPEALPEVLWVLKASGFDLIFVETAGIGQGDSQIVDLVDVSLYVMTSEFGAATQLEKIDMLDYADLVVVNKYEKRGGEDAVRDVQKQVQQNKDTFDKELKDMPVFGTIASKFNDDGVTALYLTILDSIREKTGVIFESHYPDTDMKTSTSKTVVIPPERTRYLADIAETIRSYHKQTEEQADVVRRVWHLRESAKAIDGNSMASGKKELLSQLRAEVAQAEKDIREDTEGLLSEWEDLRKKYSSDELVYKVRGREIRQPLYTESLAHQKIPKISLPTFKDPGEIYRYLRRENIPGFFPFTAGVFPLKRVWEDPTRMFAGEGDPARTNRRFKLLSASYEAKRLSTAFDS
ncbi:MAG: cobalamin-dependent protein, partial [Candidatus Aminicenantes bacterium]